MGTVFAPIIANRLLAGLLTTDLDPLRRHLVPVRLVCGQALIEPVRPAEHIVLIEDGIAALMAQAASDRAAMQVAMIGREGTVGGLALLDAVSPPYAGAIMMDDSPAVRDAALRFVQSPSRQVMQTAAWNASRTLCERWVRWLLMAHERVEGDDLPVTHEALSALLGARRSGVTLATAALQEDGLIRISRGCIRILDRAGLAALIADGAGAPRGRAAVGHAPHQLAMADQAVSARDDEHVEGVIRGAILHAPGHAGDAASAPAVR